VYVCIHTYIYIDTYSSSAYTHYTHAERRAGASGDSVEWPEDQSRPSFVFEWTLAADATNLSSDGAKFFFY